MSVKRTREEVELHMRGRTGSRVIATSEVFQIHHLVAGFGQLYLQSSCLPTRSQNGVFMMLIELEAYAAR